MKNTLLLLFLFLSPSLMGQERQDSLHSILKNKKEFVIPIGLIALGSTIELSGDSKQRIQENFFSTDNNVDDYLQYAPIAILYGAEFSRIPSKNSLTKKTLLLGISELSNALIVQGAKRLFNHKRPNGRNRSFPSGHTSFSFVAATVLYEEYKDANKWLAYSGYLFSSATATLRVSNNDHWVSDVLVGAGVGILIPKIVYRLFDSKKIEINSAFLPTWRGSNEFGLAYFKVF